MNIVAIRRKVGLPKNRQQHQHSNGYILPDGCNDTLTKQQQSSQTKKSMIAKVHGLPLEHSKPAQNQQAKLRPTSKCNKCMQAWNTLYYSSTIIVFFAIYAAGRPNNYDCDDGGGGAASKQKSMTESQTSPVHTFFDSVSGSASGPQIGPPLLLETSRGWY